MVRRVRKYKRREVRVVVLRSRIDRKESGCITRVYCEGGRHLP